MRIVRAMTIVAIALISSAGVARTGVESWTAESRTAMGITGNVRLSPTALTVAGKTFPLTVSADVTGFQTNQGPQAVRILKVTKPMNPVLLHHNRLCTKPVGWIAVYRSSGGKNLNMDVFSGSSQPSRESTPALCGTFMYGR